MKTSTLLFTAMALLLTSSYTYSYDCGPPPPEKSHHAAILDMQQSLFVIQTTKQILTAERHVCNIEQQIRGMITWNNSVVTQQSLNEAVRGAYIRHVERYFTYVETSTNHVIASYHATRILNMITPNHEECVDIWRCVHWKDISFTKDHLTAALHNVHILFLLHKYEMIVDGSTSFEAAQYSDEILLPINCGEVTWKELLLTQQNLEQAVKKSPNKLKRQLEENRVYRLEKESI